jgi:hypothetical protein
MPGMTPSYPTQGNNSNGLLSATAGCTTSSYWLLLKEARRVELLVATKG